MGKNRRGRPINGILVLDKPIGQSSNRSLQTAKRLFDARKAGHTGSLDPLATGVLPLCFGEATKFSSFLLDSDKAYRSTFKLGITTNSGDAEGEITGVKDATAISSEDVSLALRKFEGLIEQIPSMFSALKHQGQPLYKLARKGIEVERKARQVNIFEIVLEDFRDIAECNRNGDSESECDKEVRSGPEVDVYIRCSKGTYIRSIAEDLGFALGCGAHVSQLRRVQAGPFDIANAVALEELQALSGEGDMEAIDRLLLPVDAALTHLPKLELEEEAKSYILQGQAVRMANTPRTGMVRFYDLEDCFIGLGEVLEDGRIGPKRLIATN